MVPTWLVTFFGVVDDKSATLNGPAYSISPDDICARPFVEMYKKNCEPENVTLTCQVPSRPVNI